MRNVLTLAILALIGACSTPRSSEPAAAILQSPLESGPTAATCQTEPGMIVAVYRQGDLEALHLHEAQRIAAGCAMFERL